MACAAGPDVSKSGLVLALDGANKKTFANSVINSTSWSLGSGSATGYSQNGATAENERVTGTDPFGKSATVWETRPQGNNADDGGWASDWFNIDSTKLHRFSVWVKRTTDTSGGTFYLGLYGNNGIKRTDNSVVEGNPYWDCRGTSGFEKDVWYLVMGHCYPYNTTYTGQHPESGIYTVAGGTTKVASINACNIGADVKWAGVDVTQTIHRCYHYYCADSTTRLQLFDPRIDVIDGTEPSIRNLLSGFTASRLTDLIGTNNGTFVNGPTYSSSFGGSVSFDGSDDHILGTIPSSTFTGPHSICCWFYRRTVKQWSGLFSNNVNTTSCSIFTFIGTTNSVGANQAGVNGASIAVDLGADHLNKWIYAVITYAGVSSGSAVNVYAYKDGSLLTASGSLYWNMSSSSSYYVGRHWTSAMEVHDGFISQVSIYNRALTAAEISQNFNATRSRFGI